MKILILGASSKIGQQIVKNLQNHNHLIVSHIHKNCFHENEQTLQANFECENEVKIFCQKLKSFGKFDTLINCSSIFENDNLKNFSRVSFHKLTNINFCAFVEICNFFHQNLANKNSSIITLTDNITNMQPHDKFFSYGLSKSLTQNFIKIAAQNFAPKTRINSIALSVTLKNSQEQESNFQHNAQNNPLNRITTISDIISAIEFLNNCKSITGENICLDSGKGLGNFSYYETKTKFPT